MILLALLLASIGVADVVRAAWNTLLAVVVAVAALALSIVGCAIEWWWFIPELVAVIAWLRLTRSTASRRSGRAAIVLLAATALAIGTFSATLPTATGALPAWYSGLPFPLLDEVSFVTFALAVGALLFLWETANVIVRIALRQVIPESPAPAQRYRFFRLTTTPPAPEVILKGGRVIGPLERVFILTLALTGQFTALAAVVAAKGIIRFPEISKDAADGAKAEYFLIGSFASWALVLLVAVLLNLTA